MKILITGGEGFIGTHLVEELDSDHDIILYDLYSGKDIRNKFQLNSVFNKEMPDVVIHLAALAGVRNGEEFPDEFITTNIIGTKNVLDCCEKYNVKHLISFSSSSVLGGNLNVEVGLKEKDEYYTKSIYAMTKMAGECIVKNSKIPWTIIRPFTVYGELGRKDMVIYKWIEQIKKGEPISFFGKGDTSRGYTYVKDLVKGIKRSIMNHQTFEQVIHLGGSELISLNDVLEIFTSVLKSKNIDFTVDKLDLPDADVYTSFSNCAKAKRLLKWKPKGNFTDNLIDILTKEL